MYVHSYVCTYIVHYLHLRTYVCTYVHRYVHTYINTHLIVSSSFCCFLPASSACCSIFWCRDWSYSTKETMGWRDARDTQTKERRSREGWLPPGDASASLLASFSCEQLPSPALKTQHNGNTFKTLNSCMQLRMYVRIMVMGDTRTYTYTPTLRGYTCS